MAVKQWLQSRLRYDQAERIRGALCDALFLTGLGWLLTRGKRRGAAVLVYHSVGGDGIFADNVVAEDTFDAHMRFVRANFEPVPLSRITRTLLEGRAPDPNWIAVTFDDGYRDFVTKALPILKQHGIPASLFVPTMILDGAELFFDEVERLVQSASDREITVALPSGALRLDVSSIEARHDASLRLALAIRQLDPQDREAGLAALRSASGAPEPPGRGAYVTEDDLQDLPEWIELGSHSVAHFCLAQLDDEQLERELLESANQLARIRGSRVDCLAYPFGKPWSFDARVQSAAASAGYRAALTTVPGHVHAVTEPFAIPRIAGTRSLSRLRLNLMGLLI